MDDKLKERLLKRLQKIPKSESLETRKIALEDRLTQEEEKYWFRYRDGKLYRIRSPNTKIVDKKCKFIGYYKNIDDAKEAYNLAARKIYSDFAVLS